MTPSFTMRVLQSVTLVLSAAACSGEAEQAVAREVGSTAQAIVPVNGLRRLLVVLVDAAPDRPVAHTTAEYRQRLFGPGFPNLSDYFGAISNRSMTVVEAGLVHGTAAAPSQTVPPRAGAARDLTAPDLRAPRARRGRAEGQW